MWSYRHPGAAASGHAEQIAKPGKPGFGLLAAAFLSQRLQKSFRSRLPHRHGQDLLAVFDKEDLKPGPHVHKVKRLLLGTGAGFAALGGAQAADMPAKARPVQYVKVCSLYGDGFYYIPGFDTCLKLGGYLRV